MATRVPIRRTGAVADVMATIALAAAARLLIGPVFLNFDAFYSLIWGDQLAHGRTPDYFSPDAPAPHPLGIAVAGLLSPLAADLRIRALGVLGLFAVGALCVGLYRLGEALYGRAVGLVAAAIMATRVPTLVFGAGVYVDIPAAALVVWAAVLEARRTRRGAAVLAILAVAGLLRAEVCLLSLAYLVWLLPGQAPVDRIRAAAIAAVAPVVWLLSNALVTGSPFEPSHGARISVAERLVGYPNPDSRTGLLAVPDAFPRDMGNWLRPIPLAVAMAGLLIGVALSGRVTRLPVAVAALNVAGFACLGLIGLTIEQRYLAPAGGGPRAPGGRRRGRLAHAAWRPIGAPVGGDRCVRDHRARGRGGARGLPAHRRRPRGAGRGEPAARGPARPRGPFRRPRGPAARARRERAQPAGAAAARGVGRARSPRVHDEPRGAARAARARRPADARGAALRRCAPGRLGAVHAGRRHAIVDPLEARLTTLRGRSLSDTANRPSASVTTATGGAARSGTDTSPVRGEPHAGEDLPALGEVPVAEARRGDARVRRPRPPAQDAVAVPEEDLGVLAVGVRGEAGVAGERRGRPLPDLPGALEDACRAAVLPGPGRRLLPLGLGGEPGSARAGEGVGLEPGHVARGRIRVPRRHATVVRDVVVLLPRPPFVRPPLAALVAAALAEAQPGRVRDRPARDAEGRDLDVVRRALVVVGERAVAGAHAEATARDGDPVVVGGAQRAERRLAGREQAAELHRLAHRLGVLELVAEHHLVEHRVRAVAVRRLDHTRPHLVEVGARAGGVEQLDVAADAARRLERVVARRELGMQQRPAGEAMHEPELLVRGDVREVPDERAHDRVDLTLELGRREMPDDVERLAAHRLHGIEDVTTHRSPNPTGPPCAGVSSAATSAHPGIRASARSWGITPVRHAGGPHGWPADPLAVCAPTPSPTSLKEPPSARQHVRRASRPLERQASQDGDLGLDRLRRRRLRHRRRDRRQEAQRLRRPGGLRARRPARARPLPQGPERERADPGAEGRLGAGRPRPHRRR